MSKIKKYKDFINEVFKDIHNISVNPFIEKDHIPKNYIGQIQYYFSDIISLYPVRDVMNTQKSGFKTEPHIEIGAENFLKQCMQSNIIQVIKNDVKYLFLLTRCMNKNLENHFKKQYIVGYIKINESLDINRDDKQWKSIKGETKIVSWDDAIPVLDYYTRSFDRPRIGKYGKIDNIMTDEFLKRFDNKKNISDLIIKEIKRLDKNNITCVGKECQFYNTICKRWN